MGQGIPEPGRDARKPWQLCGSIGAIGCERLLLIRPIAMPKEPHAPRQRVNNPILRHRRRIALSTEHRLIPFMARHGNLNHQVRRAIQIFRVQLGEALGCDQSRSGVTASSPRRMTTSRPRQIPSAPSFAAACTLLPSALAARRGFHRNAGQQQHSGACASLTPPMSSRPVPLPATARAETPPSAHPTRRRAPPTAAPFAPPTSA